MQKFIKNTLLYEDIDSIETLFSELSLSEIVSLATDKEIIRLIFVPENFIVSNILGITLLEALIPSTFIFIIGILGIVFNKRNILILLMSIELMLLGISLNFIIFSIFLEDIQGQVFALFILTLAAAESAIGLAILVVYYRVSHTISLRDICSLRR